MAFLNAGLPVHAFFTTRADGVSSSPYDSLNVAYHVGDVAAYVDGNRALVEKRAGAPVAYMSQVHGNNVSVVSDAGQAPESDALVTATPGLAVAVMVADCVPILMHDAGTGAVAAVHAGRMGVDNGIVAATVDALHALGAKNRTISVNIGPAICGACYEVPADMQGALASRWPSAHATTSWGTPSLDLPAAVWSQIADVGIHNISRIHMCSREREDMFSHRRDGATGRFAGVIVCEGAP